MAGGRPLKAAVNKALHATSKRRPRRTRRPFRVIARDLGLPEGIELDDIASILERFEGPPSIPDGLC